VPGRRTRLRAARLGLVAALFGLAVVCVPGNASIESCPGAFHHYADGWDEIALPAGFVTPAHALADYALDVSTTDHLLATNGGEIRRSVNGGCTWQVSSLPALPGVSGPSDNDVAVLDRSITQVRFASYQHRAWAIGVTGAGGDETVTQPVVLTSIDSGAVFGAAIQGLPRTGRPLALAPLPGTATAYLLFRESSVTGETDTIYETRDGGSHWTATYPNLPALNGVAAGVTEAGAEVWTWSGTTLYRSVAGQPLRTAGDVPGGVSTVDVTPGLVSVFFASGDGRMVSADDGRTWQSLRAPQNVSSVTHGPLPGLLAVSGDLPNVEIDPPVSAHRKPADVSPRETNLTNLQMSLRAPSSGFVLYGANVDAIYRLRMPPTAFDRLGHLLFSPPAKPVRVQARLPALHAPELSPHVTTVTLAPHERRDVPYRLLLPPAPTPLDVYFVTDSTVSMADTIGSVQRSIQQIVEDLAGTGIDAHFGVADFRDYPMENGAVATNDWAYRRDRAIGPVDAGFARALDAIQVGGGTFDKRDSGLEAIYQAATGAGRAVGSDPSGASDIAPGQDARFRPGAVKVIVVAADAEFRHPETNPGWPGPSLATVAATLAQRGIHLVGLDVDTGSGQDPGADMKSLAAASHTVAGPDGVDCDGDGMPDLRPGDPLVCRYSPSSPDGIAPVFLGLLDSLRDLKPVSVRVAGPRDVVRPLRPTTFPAVNVKTRNDLGVPLEFRCDPPRFGRTTTIRVVASVAARQVASLPVVVKCGRPAALPVVQPLLALPPLAAVAVAVPVPPAQPNPNPNPNPNPQPQTQTNPGLASQEDEAQQLAFADDGLVTDESDLAMSALRPSQWSAGTASSPARSGGSGADERDALYLLAAASLSAGGAACRVRTARRWAWARRSP
jgi:hypothetical protein